MVHRSRLIDDNQHGFAETGKDDAHQNVGNRSCPDLKSGWSSNRQRPSKSGLASVSPAFLGACDPDVELTVNAESKGKYCFLGR